MVIELGGVSGGEIAGISKLAYKCRWEEQTVRYRTDYLKWSRGVGGAGRGEAKAPRPQRRLTRQAAARQKGLRCGIGAGFIIIGLAVRSVERVEEESKVARNFAEASRHKLQ